MLFSDVSKLPAGASASRRIVIIGSGAIGLYAASLLASRSRDVLVIEAGQESLGAFDPDAYTSIGRPHSGISQGRSRCLGGTTNLWGGQLVEFQPIDFAGRDWLPGSKWPISYEEIAPYYPKTYDNLAVPTSIQKDADVWQAISAKLANFGADLEVFLTRWMRIPNCAVMFEKQIKGDAKLSVLTHCVAVAFRGPADKIQAVKVIDKSGKSHWIEGETFILAAGTIENARLLLHTANDQEWPCPWRANSNIGRYFQDHLVCKVATVHPTNKRALFDTFCTIVFKGNKFQPKIRLRNSVLEKQKILNVQGTFLFESKASEHLVYLKQFLRAAIFSRKLSGFGDVFRNAASSIRLIIPLMWRYMIDHRVFVPGSASIALGVQAEQVACADSRITIDESSRDKYGLPKVILDWRIGDLELDSIRDFALQMRDAMQASAIGKLDIDDDLMNRRPEFLTRLRDNYHHAGGAIMGFSDQDGVVDKNLRVFGTANLFIGGASVFRTSSNANTTFTAMTLATRLVDHLTA
jgi:choline dehydrogenase-like flavoprotein